MLQKYHTHGVLHQRFIMTRGSLPSPMYAVARQAEHHHTNLPSPMYAEVRNLMLSIRPTKHTPLKGDGALIQPIMAKWLGDGFYMFQEIFDWTDMNDKQSKSFLVKPGDVITAEVNYVKEFGGLYMMNMTSKNTGAVSNYHYKLLPGQRETESVGYFVLEHQPQSCDELPPNGIVKWTNITVEVNNKPVAEPLFVAKQESPTCNSKAEVIDSSTVSITWGQ